MFFTTRHKGFLKLFNRTYFLQEIYLQGTYLRVDMFPFPWRELQLIRFDILQPYRENMNHSVALKLY